MKTVYNIKREISTMCSRSDVDIIVKKIIAIYRKIGGCAADRVISEFYMLLLAKTKLTTAPAVAPSGMCRHTYLLPN